MAILLRYAFFSFFSFFQWFINDFFSDIGDANRTPHAEFRYEIRFKIGQ